MVARTDCGNQSLEGRFHTSKGSQISITDCIQVNQSSQLRLIARGLVSRCHDAPKPSFGVPWSGFRVVRNLFVQSPDSLPILRKCLIYQGLDATDQPGLEFHAGKDDCD